MIQISLGKTLARDVDEQWPEQGEQKKRAGASSSTEPSNGPVSFPIRPGIIFRRLFLKLFLRFRHQWLLQQKQLKNPCHLCKAAHFSSPVILLTRSPAPQFSSQAAPEVEVC